MLRCILFFVGAVLWAVASIAPAETLFYHDELNSGTPADLTNWSFAGVTSGALPPYLEMTKPTSDFPPATGFLGQFGGDDKVQLNLSLPQRTSSVVLKFDAYLLRTWDGSNVPFAGNDPSPPFTGSDLFGYGYNTTSLLNASFSNGAGLQSYCPGATPLCEMTFGSDINQKNRLGFGVVFEPVAGSGGLAVGTQLSLVYHFTSDPIPYDGGSPITFYFASNGLQVSTDPTQPVADESWGLDNVNVIVSSVPVPEPTAWAFMLSGLALLVLVAGPLRRT